MVIKFIIDTETHVFKKFAYSRTNPGNPLVNPITWHEHSGDLFVQEMNVAGVDKAICASYDIDDVAWYLKFLLEDRWVGSGDYEGGAKYTYPFIKKYPDRLVWFDAINPLDENCVEWIEDKVKIGLKGIKWLPAFYGKGSAVDGPQATKVFETCMKLKLPVVLSFEEIMLNAPYTPAQYLGQLKNLVDRFPNLKVGLYHAGFGLPNMLEKKTTIDLVKKYDNLCMSTALYWTENNEYPFHGYLAVIKELAQQVGVEKLMWATDWPWTEYLCKYSQMVMAVKKHATFLNENEKERFFSGTAKEFLNLK